MNAQDIRNLSEAYMNVYEEVDKRRAPKELVDRLNASREGHMAQDGPNKPAYDAKQRLLKKAQKRKNMEEQVDLYDIILSHLLDEGYAETPEAAEAIMVNMSEDWRESIVEEVLDEKTASPAPRYNIRKGLDAKSRRLRRSSDFYTYGGENQDPDERTISTSKGEGGITKNPKKLRKQQIMGEH